VLVSSKLNESIFIDQICFLYYSTIMLYYSISQNAYLQKETSV